MNDLNQLRKGITTGASAAAAAQAAVALLYANRYLRVAEVYNPAGQCIPVPIKNVSIDGQTATAIVIKDGGDDPDVTNGLEIHVQAQKLDHGVSIKAGCGVGRVTKAGLQLAVGSPAINPVPQQMIKDAVQGYLPLGAGVELTISVPGGETAAKKTLNPKLGIIGGISILGTTGIVEPMSEEAFKKSLVPQISLAKESGFSYLCLTPGRFGENILVHKQGVSPDAVVQISNFVGFMLGACVDLGIKGIILAGHHSKIAKVAAGCFHTHSRVCDARLEVLTAHAGLQGAPLRVLEAIMNANTSEAALEILRENNLHQVMDSIAIAAAQKAADYVYGEIEVGVALFDLEGNLVATESKALEIGRKMNWHIQ